MLFTCSSINNYLDKGELYCWGNGEGGKLGVGTETNLAIPQRVEALRQMKVLQPASPYSSLFTIVNRLLYCQQAKLTVW